MTPALDSFAVSTIIKTPFDPTSWSTWTFYLVPREKSRVPKEELRTDLKPDCCKDVFGEKGSKEERKQKMDVKRDNELVEGG